MSQPTDWSKLPLTGDGRTLVEASAGTGKTWTITVLYLRLLLDNGLSPRQIIVSTFTNAAAAELSERLRGKLLWALAEAERHGHGIADDEAGHADRRWIRTRWRDSPDVLDADVRRLQAALSGFDAAPISTLHALCSRILADHPFAAGALFRGRELVDGKTLEAALVDDLWRVVSQGDACDELVRLARAAEITRASLRKYMPALLQPTVVVGRCDPACLKDAVTAVVGDVTRWVEGVRAVLGQPKLLRSDARLRKAWQALVDALERNGEGLADVLCEHRTTLAGASALTGVSKAGRDHAGVLGLVSDSVAIVHAVPLLSLDLAGCGPLRDFLSATQRWCRATLQSRLDAANQSTFDRLLTTVRTALEPRDGERPLADALFSAWPVALVDEFQDTDPVQFGILDAIYRDAEGAPRGRLVMIGDPKQAIYRFRGGDVQAYERAKAGVAPADRLTLGTNHRSSRGYVEAINQFYESTGTKLGPATSQTSIAYEPVDSSSRRDSTPLCSGKDGTPITRPLVLHRISPSDDASDLESHALRTCAGQIAWALSEHGYRIGDTSQPSGSRALQPGDIAVLLPGHAQIARLAAMLKARGVPCVTGSQKAVFQSDAARDLRLVLHATMHADDPGMLRAALAGRIFGESPGTLQALGQDAMAWDAHASHFHALRATLEQGGPLALVAALLERHASRLLATVEGERMLTDLRHLGELLQEAWVDCGGGERLLAWLADRMRDDATDADAAETRALRLESDAERVKLMTLHASKGLEFGVVYLPLMWKHQRPKPAASAAQLLPDAEGDTRYLVEGPAKDVVRFQEYEERFRILYVALTRAIHACHLFVLPQDGAAGAAIEAARTLNEVPLNALDHSKLAADDATSRIQVIDGWQSYPGLRWPADASSGAARTARPLPPAPTGPLPMRHSFTTLSGSGRRRILEEDGAAEDEVLEGRDALAGKSAAGLAEVAEALPTFHHELDALAALAGADFGNAVHALFEHRVPGQPFAPSEVAVALRAHGVRPRDGDLDALAEPLARRLQAVLSASLGSDDGPRLGELAARDMRAELEFNYLLDGASLRALRGACEAHGEPGLVPQREQILAGLMNGKIDLVFAHGGRFHVLDYKGNQLARGPRACLEDYAPAALQEKMRVTGYRFQALLYTVAVERYLRERLGERYRRDQHLGDCYYLFIRAAGLRLADGTACGVWHHRFDDNLLDAVQHALGATMVEAA